MNEEEYSFERLKVLRKVSKLDLISKMKLLLLKKKKERLEEIKLLNSNLEVNIPSYEDLLKREYELRLKKWIISSIDPWYEYLKMENDGCRLFEFANGNLNRIVEEEKKKNR